MQDKISMWVILQVTTGKAGQVAIRQNYPSKKWIPKESKSAFLHLASSCLMFFYMFWLFLAFCWSMGTIPWTLAAASPALARWSCSTSLVKWCSPVCARRRFSAWRFTGHWPLVEGKIHRGVTCWISKMRVEIYGSFPNTIYKCLQMVGFPYLECKIPGDLPHIWWEKSKVHSCFPDDSCRLSLQPSGRSARLHISLLLDNRNGTFILALQLLGAGRATDFSGAKVFRGATS